MNLFTAKLSNRKQSKNRRRKVRSAYTRQGSFSPRMEGLEDRVVLSAISVVNTDDSGPGSLRHAIEVANNDPGPEAAQFV